MMDQIMTIGLQLDLVLDLDLDLVLVLDPPQSHPLPIGCASFVMKISATMSLDETTRSARDAMSSSPYQILHASDLTCEWTSMNAANTSSTPVLTMTSGYLTLMLTSARRSRETSQ